MSTLTLRKIDSDLKAKLRMQAALHQVSMEEEVRQILRQNIMKTDSPVIRPRPINSDSKHPLDSFVGTWVHDPEFDDALKSFDRIDEELWK